MAALSVLLFLSEGGGVRNPGSAAAVAAAAIPALIWAAFPHLFLRIAIFHLLAAVPLWFCACFVFHQLGTGVAGMYLLVLLVFLLRECSARFGPCRRVERTVRIAVFSLSALASGVLFHPLCWTATAVACFQAGSWAMSRIKKLLDRTDVFCESPRQRKEGHDMAKPVKETPILFGEEARNFEVRMLRPQPVSPARAKKIQRDYEFLRKKCVNCSF